MNSGDLQSFGIYFSDVQNLRNQQMLGYQYHFLASRICIRDKSSRLYRFIEKSNFKHNCAQNP